MNDDDLVAREIKHLELEKARLEVARLKRDTGRDYRSPATVLALLAALAALGTLLVQARDHSRDVEVLSLRAQIAEDKLTEAEARTESAREALSALAKKVEEQGAVLRKDSVSYVGLHSRILASEVLARAKESEVEEALRQAAGAVAETGRERQRAKAARERADALAAFARQVPIGVPMYSGDGAADSVRIAVMVLYRGLTEQAAHFQLRMSDDTKSSARGGGKRDALEDLADEARVRRMLAELEALYPWLLKVERGARQ